MVWIASWGCSLTENITTVEELVGLDNDQQMELIADHYVKVSNLYQPVQNEDFEGYLFQHRHEKPTKYSVSG